MIGTEGTFAQLKVCVDSIKCVLLSQPYQGVSLDVMQSVACESCTY